MGGSIVKIVTFLFVLGNTNYGNAQNVFNVAFDEGNISNTTPNALEGFDKYYFVQKIFKNGNTYLEAVSLDTVGNEDQKNSIVVDSSFNIFYGFPGSLQLLTSNEFCQLYHVALDSAVDLVFFDENLNVLRKAHFDFNFFLNAGVIEQMDDSTLLILGRIQNAVSFDLFLINTDLQGNERWRTIFGEPGKDDYGFSIEYFDDKILVSGQTYFASQVAHPHLFEFDLGGNLVIDTVYQSYNNGGFLTYSDNYGLYLSSSVNVTNGRHPAILKIYSDLKIDWGKIYFKDRTTASLGKLTIKENGIITNIGLDRVNNVVTGLFFQVNHEGDSLGSKLIDHIPGERAQFHDIRPTSDGGYIMAGETHIPSQDSWIVKVNEWGCDNVPCIVSVPQVPEEENGSFSCYPNPGNGVGTVKGSFNNASSNNEIRVFNSLGQLVFFKVVNTKEFEIEVRLPVNGLYLVNLYERDSVVKSLKWVIW